MEGSINMSKIKGVVDLVHIDPETSCRRIHQKQKYE